MNETRLHAVIGKFNEFNREMKALMDSNPLDENDERSTFEACIMLMRVSSETEQCLDLLRRITRIKRNPIDDE